MVSENHRKSNLVIWYKGNRIILNGLTNLKAIRDKKVLILLDEQNLSIAARQLGFDLDFRQLADRIHNITTQAQLHLFAASCSQDQTATDWFEAAGYRVHIKVVRYRKDEKGRIRCDTNIDNLFAFWAGIKGPSTNCEAIVLASGDYGLAGELAQAIRRQPRRCPVEIMTLSLPGSTAQGLNARRNGHITANMEVGQDVLRPKRNKFRYFC